MKTFIYDDEIHTAAYAGDYRTAEKMVLSAGEKAGTFNLFEV